MVNAVGLVALYATCLSSLILPALAGVPGHSIQATPRHIAVINAESMPEACLSECTVASERLVNCNRNGTCYCDDITTAPVQACFKCSVKQGFSTSKADGVFDDIKENCEKEEVPFNNLSLGGATTLSLGLGSVSALSALAMLVLV
ncbi:hypothetical protein BKA70DRAFT_575174 [Coprinopsis sp. MPI-PUGE-AT-0042]|nr:hypothetical protein BKA70DRAFT_575174 [Coprinopsis sp. MPI-PUGE-AT-0042]